MYTCGQIFNMGTWLELYKNLQSSNPAYPVSMVSDKSKGRFLPIQTYPYWVQVTVQLPEKVLRSSFCRVGYVYSLQES